MEDGKSGRDGLIRRHAVGKSWSDAQPPWRAVRCLKSSERNSSEVTWKRVSPVLAPKTIELPFQSSFADEGESSNF